MFLSDLFNGCRIAYIKSIGSATYDKEHEFKHPFNVTALQFVGQSLCLISFWILRCRNRSRNNAPQEPIQYRDFSLWIFVLPAACDVVASIQYMSLDLVVAHRYRG